MKKFLAIIVKASDRLPAGHEWVTFNGQIVTFNGVKVSKLIGT